MKRIILHGSLADHIPNGYFDCEFSTATEAASAIEANWPGFHNKIRNMSLHVVAGDYQTAKQSITESTVAWRLGQNELHIVPAVEGSGGKRGLKAILGIALIAVSFGVGGLVAGGLGGTLTVAGTGLGITGFQLLAMGAGLVLQGLVKPPKAPSETAAEESSFYQGPLNTQNEGDIVPYVAGQNVIVGGVVIHADLIIEQRL